MEIVQHDSQVHHRVQAFIADTLERKAVSLTPEELAVVWDGIERHVDIERRMSGYLEEILSELKGRKMLVQEYLLNYLKQDEKKHEALLSALENIKKVLEANGSSMESVVKCLVMMADITEWPEMNEVYVTYFQNPFPARSAFAGTGLALGARVEIECWAVVDKTEERGTGGSSLFP